MNTNDLSDNDFSDNNDNDFSDNESNDLNKDKDFNKDDDFDENTDTNILEQIDRKLIIKYMKEGRASRTYVYGLMSYINSEEDIMKHMKKLQKSMGTSLFKTYDDKKKIIIGLGGEHIRTIYEYIIKNNICPENEISK